MSPTDQSGLSVTRERIRAEEEWRVVACVVWRRWQAFLDADRITRGWAFAAYVAALDAEEAAAAQVAASLVPLAA